MRREGNMLFVNATKKDLKIMRSFNRHKDSTKVRLIMYDKLRRLKSNYRSMEASLFKFPEYTEAVSEILKGGVKYILQDPIYSAVVPSDVTVDYKTAVKMEYSKKLGIAHIAITTNDVVEENILPSMCRDCKDINNYAHNMKPLWSSYAADYINVKYVKEYLDRCYEIPNLQAIIIDVNGTHSVTILGNKSE